jgi:signal transduction histidine kinase
LTVTQKKDQPLTPTTRTVLEYRYVHVDIIDSGIGINAVDVQADSGTTRNFGGTGLGLAISRKFVEVPFIPNPFILYSLANSSTSWAV